MSDDNIAAERQEKIAFYLTVLLATGVTGLTVWITWKSNASLLQLILTGILTFASIMGIESFVQHVWKAINRSSSTQSTPITHPRLPSNNVVHIHLLSFTLSLLFATTCWFLILNRLFDNIPRIYDIFILATIFFLAYGVSFFTSNFAASRLSITQPRSVFVNRSTEMERLLDLAYDIEGVTWVQIYGIQGIGKTRLMNEFEQHIQRKRFARRLIWYEFRCFPREERDWRTVIRETCKLRYNEQQSADEQIFGSLKQQMILTVDDFPYNNSRFIEDFLNTLIRLARHDVLVITTSRERIRYSRDRLPSDIKAPIYMPLGPLSSEDIGQFISVFERIYKEKYKRNKAAYDEIYQRRSAVKSIANGHPYTINRILTAPEIWPNVKNKPQEQIDSDELCRDICNSLTPEAMRALQIIAVLTKHTRDWNEETWINIVSEESVRNVLLEKGLVLVHQTWPPIYRMHDIMQYYLYNLVRKSGHKEEFHHYVATVYEQKLANDEDTAMLALEHYLSACDVPGILRVCKKALERSNFLGNFSVTIEIGEQCKAQLNPANKPITSVTGENRRGLVDILLLQGYAFKVQGAYDQALTTLAHCQTLLRSRGKYWQQEFVRIGIERSNIYRLQGHYTNASSELEAMHARAITLKDQASIAEITYGMARIARLQGKLTKARTYYEEARSSYEALASEDKQGWALFGLGETYRLQGDFDRSLEMYSRANQWFQQLKSKEGESYAVWGVGEIKRLRGEFSEAMQHYLRSQKLCQETGDLRSEAWAIMGIAETLRMQHNYQRELAKYKEALVRVCDPDITYEKLLAELLQQSNPGVERCHIALGLAATSRLLNQAEEAHYGILLRFYEKRDMQQCMVHVLIDVALCCINNKQKFQSYLDQAQKICTEQSYVLEEKLIQNIKVGKGNFLVHPLNFP